MGTSDFKQILRTQTRHPQTGATVVATLALGIGVNAAVFSIAYGVLQPLDYPGSRALIKVHRTTDALKSSPNARLQSLWNRLPLSILDAVDLRESAHSLTAVGLFSESTVTYTGGEEPEELHVSRVDADLFTVLGVEARLGRVFEPQEIDQRAPVAVLSHGFWAEALGSNLNVLGEQLRLDDETHTVIGVMPAGFRIAGRENDQLWLPLQASGQDLQARDHWRYQTLARMSPGASLETAQRDLDSLARRIREAHPQTNEGTGFRLVLLHDHIVGENRTVLLLLTAAAAAVLLIACVNVAHLLLARTSHRRHELAVRSALGASRSRIAGHLLTESLLLALAGGTVGLFLAHQAHKLLLAWIPADLPRIAEIAFDGRAVAFTVAASLAAGLLAGLVPALLATRVWFRDLADHRSRTIRGDRFAHSTLIVAEIALTLILTAVAGLLVTSFARLTTIDPGFETRNVMTQEIRLPEWRYPSPEQRLAFAERLRARWSRLPGTEESALTSKLPLPGPSLVSGFRVPGVDAVEGEDWTQGRSAAITFVTPGTFRALGISLLDGRGFTATDRQGSEPVVIVSRTLAEQIWQDRREAVGQSLLIRNDDAYTVIGVAQDVRQEGVGLEPGGILYLSWGQPWDGLSRQPMFAVLKTTGRPVDTAAARAAARELDPLLPLPPSKPMSELLSQSVDLPRSRSGFIGFFAVLAQVLTLFGIFAVLSLIVSRQRFEIGIRCALGATAGRIRADILGRTLRLSLIGIALGLAGSLASSRLLRGWLFALEPTDPLVLTSAAGFVLLTALAGASLPAYRASRIDPVEALRSE